jgi:phage-related protein
MYSIKFFVSDRGDCPFREFLNALPAKVQGKFTKFLDLLAGLGPDLKRPYSDALRDGIRELRVKFGGDQYRALYFFHRKYIIITHGFVKKTDSVPVEEIDRAFRARRSIEARLSRGELVL